MLRLLAILTSVFCFAIGCGGTDTNYRIPTGESVKPFVPPETDDLVADEGDDEDDEDDDDDDEEEAESDETENSGETVGAQAKQPRENSPAEKPAPPADKKAPKAAAKKAAPKKPAK